MKAKHSVTEIVVTSIVIVLALFVVVCSISNFMLKKRVLMLSEVDQNKIAYNLALISYKNNYVELIEDLPSCITEEAKVQLTSEIATEYDTNNRYDGIVETQINVYNVDKTESKNTIILTVSYTENRLFGMPMTTIIELTYEKDLCVAIKVKSYSDDKKATFG